MEADESRGDPRQDRPSNEGVHNLYSPDQTSNGEQLHKSFNFRYFIISQFTRRRYSSNSLKEKETIETAGDYDRRDKQNNIGNDIFHKTCRIQAFH